MTANVLIFDSGVGGFSVFQHVRQAYPGLKSCYLMDNDFFPYGIQPDDVLIERIVSLCHKACQRFSIDMVVIACNTASTLALPALRNKLNIPVIGVVPAIKTAAELSVSKHIALLATPATINRPYIDQLIADHAHDCQVTRIGSSDLVKLAEHYWFSNELDETTLNSILSAGLTSHVDPNSNLSSKPNSDPKTDKNTIDHMVLGCTHFPIISQHISKLYPHVQLIDSGAAIARRVGVVLKEIGIKELQLSTPTDQHTLLTTALIADPASFLTACRRIAPYQSIDIV